MRTLITGMSGAGKSTVVAELGRRGFHAVEADTDEWCEWADGDRIWRDERIRALLSTATREPLFIAGCAPNQGRFYDLLDHVVLLTAPLDVLLSRIASRTNNPFGKSDEERTKIISDIREVEPLLHRRATLVVDTSALSISEITDRLVQLTKKP